MEIAAARIIRKKCWQALRGLNAVGEGNSPKRCKTDDTGEFHRCSMQNTENIFEELLARGIIRKILEGVYAYSDIFLKVFRYFRPEDRKRTGSTVSRYQEYEFPVLYPLDSYQARAIFESFPHHIMFQSVMKNDDLEVIDNLRRKAWRKRQWRNRYETPVNVLPSPGLRSGLKFLKNQMFLDTPEIYLDFRKMLPQ